jgi:hypothetical protein
MIQVKQATSTLKVDALLLYLASSSIILPQHFAKILTTTLFVLL